MSKAFGEQNPIQGEDAVSWQTWSDGVGGIPTITGDANWGKLNLDLSGEEGRSVVYDLGSTITRLFTLEENRYGSGTGVAILQIRGDTTSFTQDSNLIGWEDYSGPVLHGWRYVQIREITIVLGSSPPAEAAAWTDTEVTLMYHTILTDNAGDIILPWYSPGDRAASYDHLIRLIFEWWLDIVPIGGEPNLPYYVMHQRWQAGGHFYGTGGDQIAMAISSWLLMYAYTGDDRFIDDMILMADILLASGISSSGADWPYLLFPYQIGPYDAWNGDMVAGTGYLQPDKSGSFAYELLNLYKITADSDYLTAAVNAANTLASKTIDGDDSNSPLPYRVRASNGSVYSAYTTNFASILMLWEGLITLNQGNVSSYATAHSKIITWLKTYPVVDDDWGPFFEDVAIYSDTQINMGTMAMYIMDHRTDWGSSWDENARAAMDWAITNLGKDDWDEYGVYIMGEQTAYNVAGNSHTARQAAIELRYAELTGDTTNVANAIRQLSWATYFVNTDGENTYPNGETWLTDGYGDYVRHFIRAMASLPYLSPSDEDHLLRSSSIVNTITYGTGTISYQTFDASSREKLRVTTFTPASVTAGGVALPHRYKVSDLDSLDGWSFDAEGGLNTELNIRHSNSGVVVIS